MEKDVSLGSHNIEEQQQEGTTLASMVVPAPWKRKKKKKEKEKHCAGSCVLHSCVADTRCGGRRGTLKRKEKKKKDQGKNREKTGSGWGKWGNG